MGQKVKTDIIDELFRKYYNEALLYTLSLCHSRETAEDVVSTAFFKALESADDSIKSFKPWLLSVCRNEYYSICRKQKHMSGGEIPEELSSSDEEFLETIIRQEEYRALYQAIGHLPEPQREVITLFYFSGLTVREAAEATGKSESNVKVLLYRARENLKKFLGG